MTKTATLILSLAGAAFAQTTARHGSRTLAGTGSLRVSYPNASTTGTIANRLAKLTGSPSSAAVIPVGETSGAIGIVAAGAGTSGSAEIAFIGKALCEFDGATSAGDYVQISSSVAGKCHDAGAAVPASGQIIGVVTTTNGALGTYEVDLTTRQLGGAGTSGEGGLTVADTAVNFSTTPSFVVTASTSLQTFRLTLADNVSSSTLATTNATNGQYVIFKVCQDGTGGRAFAWPANVIGAAIIDSAAGACSQQIFLWDGTNASAITPTLVTGTAGSAITLFGASSGSNVISPAAVAGAGSTTTLPPGASTTVLPDAGSANQFLTGITTGGVITKARPTEVDLSFSDITANDVSSARHGFAPKSPGDSTQFLNGAVTPGFAAVKDSDLAISDISANNVNVLKHGFVPKAPNDTTKCLVGDGTWGSCTVGAGGGDFSTVDSTSVDGEIVVFSGTSGKAGRRATGTGIAKLSGGVLSAIPATGGFSFVIGDGINTISSGLQGWGRMPYSCTLSSVTLAADTVGSIVVDLWKDIYVNFPPNAADSVTASSKPTLSSAQKSSDSTLSGWNLAFSAGDWIKFNVDSASTLKQVVLSADCTR